MPGTPRECSLSKCFRQVRWRTAVYRTNAIWDSEFGIWNAHTHSRFRIPNAKCRFSESGSQPATELKAPDLHVGNARQVDGRAGVAEEGTGTPGRSPFAAKHVVAVDLEDRADAGLALTADADVRVLRAGRHAHGNHLVRGAEDRRSDRDGDVEFVRHRKQPRRHHRHGALAVLEAAL